MVRALPEVLVTSEKGVLGEPVSPTQLPGLGGPTGIDSRTWVVNEKLK